MGRTGIIVTGVVAIVLVIGGIFAFGHKKSSSTNTNNTAPTSPTDNTGTGAQTTSAAPTITYNGSGFSPSSVSVNSGDTIAIKNISSSPLQFDSNPHPVHTDDPELNIGVIDSGQTSTIKVVTKGTHSYHNHLNPSQTGTIVVN